MIRWMLDSAGAALLVLALGPLALHASPMPPTPACFSTSVGKATTGITTPFTTASLSGSLNLTALHAGTPPTVDGDLVEWQSLGQILLNRDTAATITGSIFHFRPMG